MTRLPMYLTFFLLTALSGIVAGQQPSINTTKLDLLIEQWNSVHNGRMLEGFENVYADEMLFYSKRMSRGKAILLKKQTLAKKTGFKQRLGSEIKYTVHNNGIIKCDFTKEILEKSDWVASPSYLLVKYQNKGYWITGESDYATDKKSRFKPELGESLGIEIVTEKPSTAPTSSAQGTVTKTLTTNIGSVTQQLLAILKENVFIAVGLLVSGGLIIFFVQALGSPKKKQAVQKQQHVVKRKVNQAYLEDDYGTAMVEPQVPGETYQVIENELKQNAFKAHVISLFDTVSFTYRKPKVSASDDTSTVTDVEPNLEFEFQNGHAEPSTFAIQCLYREDLSGKEIKLFPKERLQFNKQFEGEIELYYVIGIGGPPDRPNELYLIPSRQLKSESIAKSDLKPFRRAGKFTYNTGWGRLQ